LDYKTYSSKIPSKLDDQNPPHWKNRSTMVQVLFPSFYLWVLFAIIPISGLVKFESFYIFPIVSAGVLNLILQLIGITMILWGTFVACWGRVSRQLRAISWGLPMKLETRGMFHFIRHPLYASYCAYFIGFLLLFQSYLLIPLLIGIPGYYLTSLYEDDLLENQFGDEFREYRRKTGRFFPMFFKQGENESNAG
jgi:protein-S-isoprenylcysteine O-methyltransferase Ste14